MNSQEQVEVLRRQIDDIETVDALEERLCEMKVAADADADEYARIKADLREARRVARQRNHRTSGQAIAAPEVIEASVKEG